MRQVFWFDSYGNVQSKEVAEDYVLQDGELDPQPTPDVETNKEQKAFATLGMQVAQLKAQNTQILGMVGKLGLQLAKGDA
ncbi:hypothetical protein [Ligilactobacillus apodemi]|uniref:Uncharacterized protein n=1 Tax=Ligilactobacillus apodemi DSM 16634 = JCM 16172 TaxID=1423724 RepID=A0A0R1TUW6_9LACO|nr:hypothetical protein [Ligilactobacillus apodemi]KRL84606.1 hypothetical protein FC32_GL000503 [Ligilactobacillus apodemi DSM 16634 = JCM 16172]